MLYGMGEPVRKAVIQNGQRVRVYLPVGRLLPGMAYLIRRLMENTSNTSFLRQTYAEEKEIDKLILPPLPKKAPIPKSAGGRKIRDADHPGPFRNEPLLDFSRQENRSRFARTLKETRQRFGRDYLLWVGGEETETIVRPGDDALERAACDATAPGRKQYLSLRAPRHRRGHCAVEFSTGDSHGDDGGGFGGGKLRHREAGRAVTRDRRAAPRDSPRSRFARRGMPTASGRWRIGCLSRAPSSGSFDCIHWLSGGRFRNPARRL